MELIIHRIYIVKIYVYKYMSISFLSSNNFIINSGLKSIGKIITNITCTFSINGIDASYFTIHTKTGFLKLKNTSEYSFKTSYSININAVSLSNTSINASQLITINIKNIQYNQNIIEPIISNSITNDNNLNNNLYFTDIDIVLLEDFGFTVDYNSRFINNNINLYPENSNLIIHSEDEIIIDEFNDNIIYNTEVFDNIYGVNHSNIKYSITSGSSYFSVNNIGVVTLINHDYTNVANHNFQLKAENNFGIYDTKNISVLINIIKVGTLDLYLFRELTISLNKIQDNNVIINNTNNLSGTYNYSFDQIPTNVGTVNISGSTFSIPINSSENGTFYLTIWDSTYMSNTITIQNSTIILLNGTNTNEITPVNNNGELVYTMNASSSLNNSLVYALDNTYAETNYFTLNGNNITLNQNLSYTKNNSFKIIVSDNISNKEISFIINAVFAYITKVDTIFRFRYGYHSGYWQFGGYFYFINTNGNTSVNNHIVFRGSPYNRWTSLQAIEVADSDYNNYAITDAIAYTSPYKPYSSAYMNETVSFIIKSGIQLQELNITHVAFKYRSTNYDPGFFATHHSSNPEQQMKVQKIYYSNGNSRDNINTIIFSFPDYNKSEGNRGGPTDQNNQPLYIDTSNGKGFRMGVNSSWIGVTTGDNGGSFIIS